MLHAGQAKSAGLSPRSSNPKAKLGWIVDSALNRFTSAYELSGSPLGIAARAIKFGRGLYFLRQDIISSDGYSYLNDKMRPMELPAAFLGPLMEGVEPRELDMFLGQHYTVMVFEVGEMKIYFAANREQGSRPQLSGRPYIEDTEEEFAAKFSKYVFQKYGDVIEIRVVGDRVNYVSLPAAEDYIGPYDEAYFDNYLQAFESKGMDRVLLFIGKPGTGKSTMARRIANLRGKRCVIAPMSLLTQIGEKVLNYFSTGVLVMEDLHLSVYHNAEQFLHFMENIQKKLNGTVLIGTASRIITIDEGAHRPGRFDDIFRFKVPNKDERREILQHYAKKFGCVDDYNRQEKWLLSACEHLPPAYLRSIVQNIHALGDQDDLKERLEEKIDIAKRLVAPDRSEFDHNELIMGGVGRIQTAIGFNKSNSSDPFSL